MSSSSKQPANQAYKKKAFKKFTWGEDVLEFEPSKQMTSEQRSKFLPPSGDKHRKDDDE